MLLGWKLSVLVWWWVLLLWLGAVVDVVCWGNSVDATIVHCN